MPAMPATRGRESAAVDDAVARATAAASAADTDRYFLGDAAGGARRKRTKATGAAATLASLPNRPDQESASRLVRQHAATLAGSSCSAGLQPDYAGQFRDWSRQMRVGGFSLLLYGAGSKRSLLRRFQAECLAEELCAEVDGHHPDASPRAILGAILEEIVGAGSLGGGKGLTEMARLAAAELERAKVVLYLLIHGLDGPQLRTDKAVDALVTLVGSPAVRMAATVDHRLCQLLWDPAQLTRMSCLWYQAPTLLPYVDELPETAASTGSADGPEVRGGVGVDAASATLQMSGLRHLMASLPANARDLFVMLARRQMERPGEPWPLDELYWTCRDRLIVTSELMLHAHLKEFRDHGLVRLKSGGGQAGDSALVPLPAETLEQFLAAFGDD